ncbi:hypothetical protein F2Q70_00044069 [Brassica cretica]|uniref:N-acetylglucosaminylphosphatidylinositol deacetylase n=1 Tax=Brassica cretica TaxID=69181 RepID=A0A8S9KDH9_BRACR|nr:hypothetical protein F2Q70_00044069 [Brassica cretica]
MAWLVATLSLIVIWVASIFKVFFGATSSNKKNVLFVIAHPDDESMFFSPTINYLASSGYNLHMLCFSTGNADGMGSIRKDELHQACAVLRVPLEQLKVLDHPNLQDGFGQVWSHDLLAKVIGEEVSNHDIHTVIANLSKLYIKDDEAPSEGVEDMTRLSYLHEPAVLENLATRYGLNEIYTYTGNILIAVNPFQGLPHLYDADVMEKYKEASFKELSPHVFAIGGIAYREMINEGRNKCILVSGESGSGKTETTKVLMRYLAYFGGHTAGEGRTVENQVLEDVERFKLGDPKSFRYLNQSSCFELDGVNDAEEYLATRNAMDVVGISEQEQDAIFRVVAAILHLGNIEFCKGEDADSSSLKDEQSKFHLQMTSELLMCDSHSLEDALCKRIMVTPEEVIKRSLDPLGAAKPGGIIALLDEACMLPKSTPETFSEKLYQTFRDHKRFIKPKLTRSDFTLVHYAGDVRYQSDQFLDKNKDYVVAEHQDMLNASKCSFVSGLFPPLPKESSKSKFSSIGARFKLQLQQLMETLNYTEPHYIRCVKPNNLLQPTVFDNANVLHQLRSGGVLEAIRVKCAGYPTNRTFIEFLNRFIILAPEILKGEYEADVACKWILEKKGLTGYQIGKSKVFLRAGQMAELDAHRTRVLGEAARMIQGQVRTRLTRERYVLMRRASVQIQANWRRNIAGNICRRMRREEAAIKIQKNLRRQVAKKEYGKTKSSAVALQSGVRTMVARHEFRFKLKSKAATVIQAYWRGYSAISDYKKLKKASLVYQNRLRGRIARKQLGQSNQADKKKETEHEREVELSNQVEEAVDMSCVLHSEPSDDAGTGDEQYPKIFIRADSGLDKSFVMPSEQSGDEEIEHERQTKHSILTEDGTEKSIVLESEKPYNNFSVVSHITNPIRDTEVESLTAEVEMLKALLVVEKQRADISERKCAEARELGERRRKRLEETERRVYQLQDSLNRLLYSMSDQFSQLKSILRSPSMSSTMASVPVVRDDLADSSENSEASSSDSDFTFPAPSTSSADNSNLQVIVQDLSTTESKGTENDKERGFEDYF